MPKEPQPLQGGEMQLPSRRAVMLGLAGFATLAALTACGSNSERQITPAPTATQEKNVGSSEIDLLGPDYSWETAGVKKDGSKLQVKNVGLKIVNQDGSEGQDNPPVNLINHLQIDGDFTLSATMTIPKGEGAITLYGEPPIISDESRSDVHSMRIALQPDDSSFWVGITNGDENPGYVTEDNFDLPTPKTDVEVIRTGDQITIKANGEILGTFPDSGLFDSGKLWLGLDAGTAGDSWSLEKLKVVATNGGKVSTESISNLEVEKSADGLNTIANKTQPGFRVGAAMALGPMVSNDQYAKLALNGNFGVMTPENAMKAQFIHPKENVYAFEEADALVAIAKKHGMDVHGHALVFGEANPQWMQDIARDHPERLQSVMVNHIKTVVGHYKGRVDSWDVGNEILADNDNDTEAGKYGMRQHIWYEAMGPAYLEIALRAAHDADPDAKLYVNDFGMESDDDRFNDMLALVTKLKADGVPIYGVGFQAHIDDGDTIKGDTTIDAVKLKSRFSALEAIGVKARVSELDVSSSDEMEDVMSDAAAACIQHPSCDSVTFWGISDKFSSGAEVDGNTYTSTTEGLPWDSDFKPTTVVDKLKKALSKVKP